MFIKDLFDFIRNFLLSAAVLAASLFIEFQSQDGIGRELIFSERFYEDRSQFLTGSYTFYGEQLIEEELEIYFHGFKQGGIRVIERMSPTEYKKLQESLQRIELLRYERYKDAVSQRWLTNSLFALSFVLALLNCGWISWRVPSFKHRCTTWTIRAIFFGTSIIISMASLVTIMDARRTELFAKDVTREDLIAFAAETLGDNEIQSFSADHLSVPSFDSLRWS